METNNGNIDGGTCKCFGFNYTAGVIIGYITNPLPLNANPMNLGRFDIHGSAGIVPINMYLLPNGKVLFTARPEVARGGPNPVYILYIIHIIFLTLLILQETITSQMPTGEMMTIFDPISATFVTSHLPENVSFIFWKHAKIIPHLNLIL